MEIQKRFFELAKNKLSANLRLVDVVGEVLSVGSDSAYRRIRGEKQLSMGELAKLCQHFNVSLDTVLNHRPNTIPFNYSPLDMNNFESYYAYKNRLALTFEAIAAAKEKEFIVTALDISIFHLTPFRDLSLFKVYTWFQAASYTKLNYEQFLKSIDVERVVSYSDRIRDAYNQIPSTEIWTHDTLNPILNLLEYFSEMDCFENKKEVYSVICRQLLELIENTEKNAERGWKEYNGQKVPFNMCLSSLYLMNDFMVAKRDGLKTTMLKLHTTNALITDDDFFGSEIEKWLKDAASKSLSLTGTSARERFMFFKHLKDKVHHLSGKFGL